MFTRSDKLSDSSEAEDEQVQDRTQSSREKQLSAETSRKNVPPSIISAGLTVKGDLESTGEIQVDGHIDGDIRGKAVVVGAGGSVKGSVVGDSATIAGTIDGRVEAMMVIVRKTAKITGDIVHQCLQVESGGYFDGHCSPTFGKAEVHPMGLKAISSGTSGLAPIPEKIEESGRTK